MEKKKNRYISTFIKRNMSLFYGLVISFIYIIIYAVCKIKIDKHYSLMLVLNIVYNITLSYIAGFIFYIFQVYIPDVKKEKRIKKEMFTYYNYLYCEYSSLIEALKTLQTCLNNDVEEFKKCSFQSLPREDFDYNDNEMKAVFNENISWSLNLLESYLKGAEKDIRLMQTLNDLTKYEYDIINQEVFKKINSYYDMKIQREKYKNNIPYFAEIYYRCVVGMIEEIFDVYSIDEIRNECN